MKVKITVDIKKIGNFRVNEKLLETYPDLMRSTMNTFSKYAKEMDKYFREKHNIHTKSKVEEIET